MEWVNVKEKELTMSECRNRDEEEAESTRVRQTKNKSVKGNKITLKRRFYQQLLFYTRFNFKNTTAFWWTMFDSKSTVNEFFLH